MAGAALSAGARLGDALGSLATGQQDQYEAGLALGAKTQQALADARKNVLGNNAKQAALSIDYSDPNAVQANLGQLLVGDLGADFSASREGLLKQQEYGNRGRATDTSLPLGERNAALLGVANAPVDLLQSLGNGQVANRFDGTGVETTGLGNSIIDENTAQAAAQNALAAKYAAETANPEKFRAQPVTDLDTIRAIAAAKAGGTAAGKVQGGAEGTLPATLQGFDNAASTINQLVAHPGFNGIYGWQGAFPNAPNGAAAGAEALRNQIKGQSFLQAIQSLRGLGSVTEVEGTKATNALTAALDPKLNADEAKLRFGELQARLNELRAAATQVAARPAQPGAVAAGAQPPSFATEAEAEAAGIAPGTRVVIGGVAGTWQ